jgi:hypothetical protein
MKGYVGGCTCAVCKGAWSSYVGSRRAVRFAYTAEFGLPEHVKHGVSAYGNWGCKCTVCRHENAVKSAEAWERRIERLTAERVTDDSLAKAERAALGWWSTVASIEREDPSRVLTRQASPSLERLA